jgi:L-asparagine oxygenase
VITRVLVTADEQIKIRGLIGEIAAARESLSEDVFLERAAIFGQELPRRLREIFYNLKLREGTQALLIQNNPILANDVGDTPKSHWKVGEPRPLNLAQILHGLYASLLGEPFGFETQQKGRIFNDLIPIPGAPENSSSGKGKVSLHTENYSHTQPYMPDYLGLLCLRNDQFATTTISHIKDGDIPEPFRELLFTVFPFSNSLQQSVFFGNPDRPYMRYSGIKLEECTMEMRLAFRLLSQALEGNQARITLTQGECLYLDNFVVVHGRAPFDAQYGPRGRWFSRLCILRDLRSISALRSSPESRVILRHKTLAHSKL